MKSATRTLIPLLVIVALAIAAIVVNERAPSGTEASARGFLYFLGQVEHEATRVPARVARLSDEEEIHYGERLARPQIENLNNDDQKVEGYIRQLGLRVAAQAQRRLPYQFHYITDRANPNYTNAFALPGGHVFMGKGLLQLMDSEDQMAAVLGHEIEHVDQRHCAERVELEATARKLDLGMLGQLAQMPVQLFQAGYSKQQELDADREGTRIAVAAGYSPQGALRLFETIGKYESARSGLRKAETPQDEAAIVVAGALKGYLQSHPEATERIAQLKRETKSNQWAMGGEKPIPGNLVTIIQQ